MVKTPQLSASRNSYWAVLGLGYYSAHNHRVSADTQKYLACEISYLRAFSRIQISICEARDTYYLVTYLLNTASKLLSKYNCSFQFTISFLAASASLAPNLTTRTLHFRLPERQTRNPANRELQKEPQDVILVTINWYRTSIPNCLSWSRWHPASLRSCPLLPLL